MDFFKTVKSRCSVREFNDKEISEKDLSAIIDTGRLSPTARKEEPWEFITLTHKETLIKLAKFVPNGPFIKDCAVCVVVVCRETKYYLEDGCAAVENILLAARALDIGSCWVAGDKKDYCTDVLKLLSVPAGYHLVALLALGYPKKGFFPLEKRPLAEIWHKDKF
jgi:nitroreductase